MHDNETTPSANINYLDIMILYKKYMAKRFFQEWCYMLVMKVSAVFLFWV